MAFDPSKPCTTRDGRPARIICTDRKSDASLLAIVGFDEGKVVAYLPDGTGGRQEYGPAKWGEEDLINIPEKVEGWVNVYRGSDGDHFGTSIWPTRPAAEIVSIACKRVACIKVSFTEGEGL